MRRLDTLEHDGDRHDPRDQHGREIGLRGTPPATADPLAYQGEDVEEHEHEQERLDHRPSDERSEVLLQYGEVAEDQGAATPRGLRRTSTEWGPARSVLPGDASFWGRDGHLAQLLPVRVMNTVSSVGSVTDRSTSSKPSLSAAATTRGTIRSSLDVQLHAALDTRVSRLTPSMSRSSCTASAPPSRFALTMTTVSAPTDCRSAGRCVEGEDLAVIHDRDAIAELLRLLHVVRGEQDRLAVAVELAEYVPQREAALRIEPRRRLVEEQNRRPVEDRARDHQPLRHPAGERVHRHLAPISQLELVKQLVRATDATSAAEIPNSRPW